MKLSIIIPHFNTPATLEVLLESILAEETLLVAAESAQAAGVASAGADAAISCSLASVIEVIVIDDNSTKEVDIYNDVKARYSAAYPGVITFLSNTTGKNSAGTCRNIGLDHATGDWLLFADADDYFVSGWYDLVASHFQDEADLIYFSPTSFDVQAKALGTRHISWTQRLEAYREAQKEDDVTTCAKWEATLRFDFGEPWSKLVRHSLVKEHAIRFAPTLIHNDSLFSGIVGRYAKIAVADPEEIIYCVTHREVSTITRRTLSDEGVRMKAIAEYLDYLWQYAPKEVYYQGLYAGLVRWCVHRVYMHYGWKATFGLIPKLGIHSVRLFHQLEVPKMWQQARGERRLCKAMDEKRQIYIYGAGLYGEKAKELVESRGGKVQAFVVSQMGENAKEIEGVPVMALGDVTMDAAKDFFIIAMKNHRNEVASALRQRGVKKMTILPRIIL